jgi:hypothetical protein
MWWTEDRSRLVPTGDPDAAVLGYVTGDEIPDDEASRVGLVESPKAAQRPHDKARRPANDKGAS